MRYLAFLPGRQFSYGSVPGVQFSTLAFSMNSSVVMSPRAKRSARTFLASASGEPRPAHGGGPIRPVRTRKNSSGCGQQQEEEEHASS